MDIDGKNFTTIQNEMDFKIPQILQNFSFAFLPQNRKYELPLRTKNIFFSLTSNSTHDLNKISLYIDGYLLGEEDDQYI